jgi:hypothetical protein
MLPRPLNVVLLLSAEQDPHPTEEVETLAQEGADGRLIHFAVTRYVSGLEPGVNPTLKLRPY